MHHLKDQFRAQCDDVEEALQILRRSNGNPPEALHNGQEDDRESFTFTPIGHIRTPFSCKNATPRQPSVCTDGSATLRINKAVFNNPHHSLEKLEEFSHIWLLFVFDRNKRLDDGSFSYKSKVCPPRLNGTSVGVFSTRSPHRPCPIGLSLVRLNKIQGDTVHVLGVDLVDGTPILDIKPYIPDYDIPRDIFSSSVCARNVADVQDPPSSLAIQQDLTPTDDAAADSESVCRSPNVASAKWISEICPLAVDFTQTAHKGLMMFHGADESHGECSFCLRHFDGVDSARSALQDLLGADPRSVYRKKNCTDRLYYCALDALHVTAWFDDADRRVEVLKVSPLGNGSVILG